MTVSGQMQSMPSSAVTKVARFLLLVFVLLVVPLPLLAQGSQGTISGGVFDSTGNEHGPAFDLRIALGHVDR